MVVIVVFTVIAHQVIRVRPIAGGVIPTELEPVLVHRIGQLFADIATVGRVHDIVIRELRRPIRKPIMMLGRENEIFHARRFGGAHELISIEIDWVELLVERVILGIRHQLQLARMIKGVRRTRPADFNTGDTRRPPVDKEPKLIIQPPIHLGGVRLHLSDSSRRGMGFLCNAGAHPEGYEQSD